MPTGKRPVGPNAKQIAGVLRAEQARSKIGQQAIADATGISQTQISKYLNGKSSPNVDELEAICRALGLDYINVVIEARQRELREMGLSNGERAELDAAIAERTTPPPLRAVKKPEAGSA